MRVPVCLHACMQQVQGVAVPGFQARNLPYLWRMTSSLCMHHHPQVVQFYTNTEPDTDKLAHRLNSLLSDDVRVHAAWRTAPDFSVTCTALTKVRAFRLTAPVVQRSPV